MAKKEKTKLKHKNTKAENIKRQENATMHTIELCFIIAKYFMVDLTFE